MSRTRNETEFAQMLGRIGEQLAPDLMKRLGMTQIEDLNQFQTNHPWADYAGRLNNEWALVAVRTRLNWRKPKRAGVALTSYGFNGAGPRKAKLATDRFRRFKSLDENTPIQLIWLAIAIDLDNTYEAYWGYASEMRPIPRKNGDNGLRIRMAAEDRERYTAEERRLAWREPVEIEWNEFPGEWACAAREHYLKLDTVEDRNRRIEEAVRMCLPLRTGRPRVLGRSVTQPAHNGKILRPAKLANTVTPCAPESATLENALRKCGNPEVAAFIEERLSDVGQSRMARALSYACSNRRGSRPVIGWYLTLFQTRARVRQRGRFSGDEKFWRTCLSEPDSVKPLDNNTHLCFYLSTAADCRIFQAVMENVAPTVRLGPFSVSDEVELC